MGLNVTLKEPKELEEFIAKILHPMPGSTALEAADAVSTVEIAAAIALVFTVCQSTRIHLHFEPERR